jgi:molecular chaperone GrpE
MIKKRRPDDEEPGMEYFAETPDNKENNNTVNDLASDSSESNEEGAQPDNFSEPEKRPSDNVVSKEKELEVKLAEMQDKYIRLSAEFDNYRKRTLREKMDLSRYATEELLLKLLPVMDDFERAISHMESSIDSDALKNGIDLIYIKFNDFLRQNDVKEIATTDAIFNVDLHDAIAKVAVEDDEKKGKIIDVVQKGYYLHDKVIRHSKVVVGE